MDPTEPPAPHDRAQHDLTPDAALPPGALAGGLLDASDRLNAQLMRRLEARGWPPLTRSRSLLFRHLGAGVDRPAKLARALDITRQSMQKLLEGLEAEGLVRRVPDPRDARAQRVRLTPHGQRMVADAEVVLRDIEHELAARIGGDRLQALRSIVGLLLSHDTVAPVADGGDRPEG